MGNFDNADDYWSPDPSSAMANTAPGAATKDSVEDVSASGSSDGCYMQCVCCKSKAFPLF